MNELKSFFRCDAWLPVHHGRIVNCVLRMGHSDPHSGTVGSSGDGPCIYIWADDQKDDSMPATIGDVKRLINAFASHSRQKDVKTSEMLDADV